MPTEVTYRVKRSSLPGQERVAKKQRTDIPNVFIKRETLNSESDNEERSVGEFNYSSIQDIIIAERE
jgi:hypothetical protein